MKTSAVIRVCSLAILLLVLAAGCSPKENSARSGERNLAIVATPSGSVQNRTPMTSLNDGLLPVNTGPMRMGGAPGGPRPPQRLTAQWVEYTWVQPVSTKQVAVYWWNFENSVRLPLTYRIKYWNGSEFVAVNNPSGLGLENNQYNITTFDQVETTRLRLEADSVDRGLSSLIEWQVIQAEKSPDYPPVVSAGTDRIVMLNGKTYLSGKVKSVTPVKKVTWSKASGPGNVTIDNPEVLETTATFSAPGEYILNLAVREGKLTTSAPLKVKVTEPPVAQRLDVVYTKRYKIDSPL